MDTSTRIQTSPEELIGIQLGIAQVMSASSDPLAILDHMLAKLDTIRTIDAVGVYFRSNEDNRLYLRGSFGLVFDSSPKMVEFEDGTWPDLNSQLEASGLKTILRLPISPHEKNRGFLVAASFDDDGLTPSIHAVLQTVVASLSSLMAGLKTEAALRSNRNNLETVLKKCEDFLLVVDLNGSIVTCNESHLDKLGYARENVVALPVEKLLPQTKPLFDYLKTPFAKVPGAGKRRVYQGNLVGANSCRIPVETRVSRGRWDGKDVWYMICRDLTAWKVMEVQRDHLARAIEQTTDSVVITDVSGSIIYTNPAFSRLTGYSREEALGQNPRLLQSGKHSRAFYRNMWDTISQGETWTGRFENTTKDGTSFVEEAAISPMEDEKGIITHFIGVKRDISAEIELENRLRESQKMEAIGALAGGIAHDFNNILYALLGYGQLALDDLPEAHPANELVQEICKAGERATKLVDKMLTFGRRVVVGLEKIDLKPVIEEALSLARASLPATIEMTMDLEDDCYRVMGNAAQINQVILNLCTNAENAMKGAPGSLKISLTGCESGMGVARDYPDLPSGSWLCLQCTDSGVGMDKVVQDRIFEPYFTTKKHQEGTGLGLATAHGIILSHKGHIYVKSALGAGTTVVIFLPVIPEGEPVDRPVEKGRIKKGQEHPTSQRNIMIIDDEKMIVDVLCKALPKQGYEAVGFTEGIEALEVFRASPQAFDLVITDQTMPHITGFEVAAELLSIRPDLPIILATGYIDQAKESQAKGLGIKRFVSKPMRISELSTMVRELLDETIQV